jgi:hypothetical protein
MNAQQTPYFEDCACGCGCAAEGRSRYFRDHFTLSVEARRKLRETRKYAKKAETPFRMTYEEMRDLILAQWPTSAGRTTLRRVDAGGDFELANVVLECVEPLGS